MTNVSTKKAVQVAAEMEAAVAAPAPAGVEAAVASILQFTILIISIMRINGIPLPNLNRTAAIPTMNISHRATPNKYINCVLKKKL
jgi:hypothetical protein